MSNEIAKSGEILLYSYEGTKEYIDVYFKDETFWLTQSAMAELFDCSSDNISLHLKNIYEDDELQREATTEKFSVVRQEGKRQVRARFRMTLLSRRSAISIPNSENSRIRIMCLNLIVKQQGI